MEPNVPLLRKTMEHIKEHPEHWLQDTYRIMVETGLAEAWGRSFHRQGLPLECGTAMCFAGWACDIAGVEWRDDFGGTILVGGGETSSAATMAQELLGITGSQASYLFSAGNTIEDLEWIVEQLIEGTFVSQEWFQRRNEHWASLAAAEDAAEEG